ncbi:MAG: polysaccharide deacetylase family protein [Collinsella sp.]|nr:polysaccharide deacetylase family protein [Collinsella sp.]
MKCFTCSFDDGTVEDARITEMLRDRGLAATFNLNPGLFGQGDDLAHVAYRVRHEKIARDQIAEVYRGFEVAVHGYSHARLGSVGKPMAAYEIVRAKAELEEIVREPVRGMAWPVSSSPRDRAELSDLVRSCGICYGRTTRRSFDCRGIPEDFLFWDAACSFVQPEMEGVLKRFCGPLEVGSYQTPYLLYVWGHGYEATGLDAWKALEDLLDAVAGRDDTWSASNIEVFDYVQALRSLVYSSTGEFLYNPSRMDVWLLVDRAPLRIPSGETVSIPAWC